MQLMKPKHQFTYFVLIIFKKLISNLSDRTRYKLSTYIGKILFHIFKVRRGVAENNIKRAFPLWNNEKINRTLEKTYIFFSNNLINFIGFPFTWKNSTFNVSGSNFLDSSFKKGNGIIMITGHFGAWEILGKWLGDYANLFTGVAFKQKNLGAHKFFIEQRELSKTQHIFKKESFKKMYRVLELNGILGLVSDQDAGKKGTFVNFFGSKASTPKGAALFFLNTKSPMIFASCIQLSFQNYKIEFIPIEIKKEYLNDKDVENITQTYTTFLENYIKKYPEQYFWFHKRWKTKES